MNKKFRPCRDTPETLPRVSPGSEKEKENKKEERGYGEKRSL